MTEVRDVTKRPEGRLWDSCDRSELDERFDSARCPDMQQFSGRYEVKMLGWMRHFPENYKLVLGSSGLNKMWNVKLWGRFQTKYWLVDSGTCLLLDYNVSENGPLLRGIRDYVKQVSDGLYLGKFCYVLLGKPTFLAYFILRRVICG